MKRMMHRQQHHAGARRMFLVAPASCASIMLGAGIDAQQVEVMLADPGEFMPMRSANIACW